MFSIILLLCVIFPSLISSRDVTDWICPPESQICFQRMNDDSSWRKSRELCEHLGAELPGAKDSEDLRRYWIPTLGSFWTSLCFNHGRLQWLGKNPHEERNLSLIEKLLADLTMPYIVSGHMYCFYSDTKTIDPYNSLGLSIKSSQNFAAGTVCVSDRRSPRPIEPAPVGQILSVSIVTSGMDIYSNPIGQNRNGFVNILGFKMQSFKLRCIAETTNPDMVLDIRWVRNGGYMDNISQEIEFTFEEQLVPWVGFINCEVKGRGQQKAVQSQGFNLVLGNTITARLVSSCVSCRLQTMLETAKIILTQFVEVEIHTGVGRAMEFYSEPPLITKSNISFIIHLRNKRIDKFDFKMALKLGKQFQLTRWAINRSLFLPNSTDLLFELISPCNMALPQDEKNLTWIGYNGQIVPSGNLIGGPICIDKSGMVVTRSCTLSSELRSDCSTVVPRRIKPLCFPDFIYMNGKCYKQTDATSFSDALSQCWAGWPLQPEILLPDSLSNWVQVSREWTMNRIEPKIGTILSSLVWLPLCRINPETPLATPIWNWNTVSNRWISHQPMILNASKIDHKIDNDALCAAFDLKNNIMMHQPCQNRLPMICTRPLLPTLPIVSASHLSSSFSNIVDKYFCPPGWLTHWLVLDVGLCYRRFTLEESIDADEAQRFCIQKGGFLATAPTHTRRIALEQIHAFMRNLTTVDAWIGLIKNQDEQKYGDFVWVKEERDQDETTVPYSWHPYNDFANGYGVSIDPTTNDLWSWPRDVKLRGVFCQKTVTDWQRGLRLRLESNNDPSRTEYALHLSYTPKPDFRQDIGDGVQFFTAHHTTETAINNLLQQQNSKNPFWQSHLNVVCHFVNFVRHINISVGIEQNYRASIPLPSNMGSGSVTCEAWLDRPSFRFKSNTILHRPAFWHNFIVVVSKRNRLRDEIQPGDIRNKEFYVNDLLQRLNTNQFSFLSHMRINVSIDTIQIDRYTSHIFYRLSIFLSPNMPIVHLATTSKRCRRDQDVFDKLDYNFDLETLLYWFLQSCLPLLYLPAENYKFVEVKSTVACPFLHSTERKIINSDFTMTINQLSWPRAKIGQTVRSAQNCWINGYLIHRTCMGSFRQGAIWGLPKIIALNWTLETSVVCQASDPSGLQLHSLERTIKDMPNGGISPEFSLKQLHEAWNEPHVSISNVEITIGILRDIIKFSINLTIPLNRYLFASVLEKMVEPDRCQLEDLQLMPVVLNDFIHLFSDWAILNRNRSSRVRLNLGHEVMTIAEISESAFRQQHFTSFDFSTVTVALKRTNKDTEFGSFSYASATLLPSKLLLIDPITKENFIELHELDATDPSVRKTKGKFIAGRTAIYVDIREALSRMPRTISFWLIFKEKDMLLPKVSGDSFLCAKWDSRLTTTTGGWVVGDCWYLGKVSDEAHICQCFDSGIYGLFRSDGYGIFRLSMIRHLPIIINVVLFTLTTSCLIIRSFFIYKKLVYVTDIVEIGARLQLLVAWTAMLFSHLSQYLFSGHMISCITLTTCFQYFMTVAFFWQTVLFIVRRWELNERWINSPRFYNVKLTLLVWGLSALIVVTIPIYKWKYLHKEKISNCWLENPVDFGLTVALVCLSSTVSSILCVNNFCRYKKFNSSEWDTNDCVAALNVLLMTAAGISAVVAASWMRSDQMIFIFSGTSLLCGLFWLYTFYILLAKPLGKHDFQEDKKHESNHHELQLKSIYKH